MFRCRIRKGFEVFIDGFSGAVDRKTLMRMYENATSDKHLFLYIELQTSDVYHLFYWNLEKRLAPSQLEDYIFHNYIVRRGGYTIINSSTTSSRHTLGDGS